ncbi:hypothetical protein MKZ38_001657 [Zalerion maritima]|uniref:Uncharacterized protein n=1 Tax=Zalerion maritima TaxID=339359 RepID=A0AAD5WRS2_9PEZI|nr:hypothetical protein MKZ38_001657 [Zalerion maritima]
MSSNSTHALHINTSPHPSITPNTIKPLGGAILATAASYSSPLSGAVAPSLVPETGVVAVTSGTSVNVVIKPWSLIAIASPVGPVPS